MNKELDRKRWLSPGLGTGILLTLFFGIALFIRVYLPYNEVFVNDWIKFTSNDAYYQMYLVDNLVHNFPHLMGFDPYFVYPGGAGIGSVRFFNWFLASIAWIIGLGSPSQHTVDVIGVYFPSVLAALTVIPVYFIGKALFNRWTGVLSAGIIALIPGEFLGRSILGFTDQHVAETLFTTVALLFLILAVKTARQKGLTFSHLKHGDWATIARPVVYSLLTGIFLGIYLCTWLGALLFVMVISIYFIIQAIIDHLRHKSIDYLFFVGTIAFLTALIIFLPVAPGRFYSVPLILALFIPPVLSGVSWLMTRIPPVLSSNSWLVRLRAIRPLSYPLSLFVRSISWLMPRFPLVPSSNSWLVRLRVIRPLSYQAIRPFFYPLSLFVLGGAGLFIFHAIAPSLYRSLIGAFNIFAPEGVSLTTLEMQTILTPGISFFDTPAWGNFATGAILSLISLGILIYIVIKRGDAGKNLLVVWSLVMLAATLGQRRFAYYFAVNVALLTGYISIIIYFITQLIIEYFSGKSVNYRWQQILEFAGSKESASEPSETPGKEDSHETSAGRNYYEILGISRNATTKEIKRMFQKLAAEHQPGQDIESEKRFKEIQEAYEVLSIPHQRVDYDRYRFGKQERARQKAVFRKKEGLYITAHQVSVAAGLIVIFFLVFFRYTGLPPKWDGLTVMTAEQALFAPPNAWCSSLDWMKDNTPDPFGDPDFYYKLHEALPPGTSYQYPDTAYGVMAWWDYGYWISRIAHRIPNANPSQDPNRITKVASFFTAQDESSAEGIIKETGSSYIIIDDATALNKFWAIAAWAGSNQTEFFDVYYLPQGNQMKPFLLFYPEYYQALSTRLYNFDGKAVTPQRSLVVSYVEKVDLDGQAYNEITSDRAFPTYEEAITYLNSQQTNSASKYRIVSENRFVSPVPLAALEHYKLVHSSNETASQPEVGIVPTVKIFEHIN